MTARELRLHLAETHGIITRGLSWEQMAAIHRDLHAEPGRPGHTHEADR